MIFSFFYKVLCNIFCKSYLKKLKEATKTSMIKKILIPFEKVIKDDPTRWHFIKRSISKGLKRKIKYIKILEENRVFDIDKDLINEINKIK